MNCCFPGQGFWFTLLSMFKVSCHNGLLNQYHGLSMGVQESDCLFYRQCGTEKGTLGGQGCSSRLWARRGAGCLASILGPLSPR